MKEESALSEEPHRIGVVGLRKAMLGAGRHNSLAVVEVEVGYTAGLEEGHRTAVVGIGLGGVVPHRIAVGEDTRGVDLDYGGELRTAAAEGEGTLVVGDMDCVKKVRTAVAAVGSSGCTGLAGDILPVGADRLVVDSFGEGIGSEEAADILLSNSEQDVNGT